MASKSTVAKMEHVAALVEKYREKRKQLKAEGRWLELSQLPRSSSATRYHNYCKITGRTRGYYRKFGVSRIMLREMANQGVIPGMTTSSW